MHGDGQHYTYFLVRNDRCFAIKTRRGDTTADVASWTEHAAVALEDARGVMRNELRVEAREAEVAFFVNGAEVHRSPRSALPVDGRYGLRLVHDLHVEFGVPRLDPLD